MIYQIRALPRRTYDVPQAFVDGLGAVRYPGTEEVRRLEYLMRRAAAAAPARRTPGGLVALGVLNDVQRRLVRLYRAASPRDPLAAAAAWLDQRQGAPALDGCVRAFASLFPPRSPEPPAASRTDLLGEVLFLSIVNRNPACAEYRELHADDELGGASAYRALIAGMESWSGSGQPALGWDPGIVDLLMAPIRHAPDSLLEQLLYVRERWGALIGDLLKDLLLAIDVLEEERAPRRGGPPSGPAPLPAYGAEHDEPERYSPDVGWMPRLVLIAKHALVWLHQLSGKHGRQISRIDEIPDAELDLLASAGFTGLWLIGIWARSPASRTIKRRTGNPEAAGSAYAVVDYVVAEELGGQSAARSLSERCAARGIRLACDMVPNHTAMDSRWVIEHPDWFIQTAAPPFPGYRFASADLSADPRVALRIEDHYYDRADAAVVFESRDTASGRTRYIYHGNDGTATPWNDTAQLDFLNPEVREAVTNQIVAAARAFPIIRFDAAMVLTRKHFQRLWYPPPGSGGGIPSRAERGMDADEMARRMPAEFWREVVDRVAAEAPDTLLLAEAFWLLEGYFVRTLGMHRVYNSAFMNMLKAEDNSRYRQLIKSTLEFDPEILKRYVNFMSNPDEEPAAAQFGTGDKYFGITVMMATLPGLPLFGHGQIEGFTEKYGMEYSRSYRDEQPDPRVVERHRREITPLLRMRALFAEAHSFRLYDLYAADGHVNENVFAYSNRLGSSFALVVYNNRYEQADGWLSLSAAYRDRARGDAVLRRSLGEEIGLTDDERCYCQFRDVTRGLEFVRQSRLLLAEGLHVSLPAFGYHVFVGFREVRDGRRRHYARLAEELGGGGVPSIEDRIGTFLAPLRDALGGLVRSLLPVHASPASPDPGLVSIAAFHSALLGGLPAGAPEDILHLTQVASRLARGSGDRGGAARGRLPAGLPRYLEDNGWVLPLATLARVVAIAGRAAPTAGPGGEAASLLDELRLPETLAAALLSCGCAAPAADRAAALLELLAQAPDLLDPDATVRLLVPEGVVGTAALRAFLGVNWFDGHEWFRKEQFEDLMRLVQLLLIASPNPSPAGVSAAGRLLDAAAAAGYRVDRFLATAPETPPSRRPVSGPQEAAPKPPKPARKPPKRR